MINRKELIKKYIEFFKTEKSSAIRFLSIEKMEN